MIHQQTHPDLDVEGCFGCKISSVTFTGVTRLKNERETGQSQSELRKEIYAEARARGRDIKRAGVTSPSSGGI